MVLRKARFACVALCCVFLTAHAQDDYDEDDLDRLEPGFTGLLETALLYDDNIYRTRSDEQNDAALVVSPELNHNSVWRTQALRLGYVGSYGVYRDYSDENFDDHAADAELFLDLSPRIAGNLQAEYQQYREERGSTEAGLTVFPEPTRVHQRRFRGGVTYGRRTSQGQIHVYLDSDDLAYVNNDQDARDRDYNAGSGTFFWNLTPKTSWLFEVRHTHIEYIDSADAFDDSSERRYLFGARWKATGLTTGEVRVGQLRKEYDRAGANDFNGLTVEAQLEWTPRELDWIQVSALRDTQEGTDGADSYYVRNDLRIHWRHVLSELWELRMEFVGERDLFTDDRVDRLRNLAVGIVYDLSERIDVELRAVQDMRNSSDSEWDYRSNAIWLSMTLQPAPLEGH